jgi:hypothetical protein
MKEERQASGEIELSYYFEEPASAHWDIYSRKTLTGAGDNVILDENGHSVDMYKSGGSHNARRTSISVKTLVKLIREHGTRLEDEGI